MAGLISPELLPYPPGNPPIRLGVMASGSGSNFAAIAGAIASGQLAAQIQVLVYNNPGIKACDRAKDHNIPAILLNHRHYPSREALDQEIVGVMQKFQVDLIVMAGWMRRVTQVLIDAFPERLINIHPSLLPSFPGLKAVEQALATGVKITGCTVHFVALEVDSGPIIVQAAVPVLPGDTTESLHQRIQTQEHQIIIGAIAHLGRHWQT